MLKLSEIAQIIGGRLSGPDALVTGVAIDTRSLKPGDLFVALPGERADGHAFANDALAGGAAAVLASRDGITPAIRVDDTAKALQQFARHWRARFTLPIAAVTGSNGKTSVVRMLSAICARHGACLAPEKSFNNYLGVPLTLLRLRAEHRFAVFELGMNAPGEIAAMGEWVRPNIGVITGAQAAHLAGVGGLAGVVDAKGELLDALPEDGVAVLNADDSALPIWSVRAGRRAQWHFGLGANAKVSARALQADAWQTRGEITAQGASAPFCLKVGGIHMVRNALAATAAGCALGFPLADITAALAQFRPPPGRLNAHQLTGGGRLIDDSYNANPASMQAAIDVLAACAGRRVLVLGAMAELGDEAADYHREIGAHARERGIEALYTLAEAPHADAYVTGFGGQGTVVDELPGLLAQLTEELREGAQVLIKGSRAARMERVVDGLLAEADQHRGPSC